MELGILKAEEVDERIEEASWDGCALRGGGVGNPLPVASSPRGAGCHDAGSVITISIEPFILMEGLVGLVGSRYMFDGWTGDVTATEATATFLMDSPKTAEAAWREDYTIPTIIVGAILVIPLARLAAPFIRNRKEI